MEAVVAPKKSCTVNPRHILNMRTSLRHAKRFAPEAPAPLRNPIPAFLCPALLRCPPVSPPLRAKGALSRRGVSTIKRARQTHVSSTSTDKTYKSHYVAPEPATASRSSLPRACPGCGAPWQTHVKDDAGYYDLERKAVKEYLNYNPKKEQKPRKESDVYTKTLREVDLKVLQQLGLTKDVLEVRVDKFPPATPVCDRCHNLLHHRTATPIAHPSVAAIQETIAESPHGRNHVYHVLDAADFPLSLIPNLQSALHLPKLRTQNRRAKHSGWVGSNRIADVTYIITRSDLLAPLEEHVDTLMPYMQDVLRDALGRDNSKARLGNVRMVSAKRGWWTRQVKEDIWDRGGAGWMVGKVNVGKSNLFNVVFPKARDADYDDAWKIRSVAARDIMFANAKSPEELLQIEQKLARDDAEAKQRMEHKRLREPPLLEPLKDEEDYDEDSLLPPPQAFTPFPVLPIASSLPGTTASPIRIPFGRNRGELVDLPGLARTSPGLESFVLPSERGSLVMEHRITPQCCSLTPGRSLLLGGGLIRMTPVNDGLVFLVHPFVPLAPHITSTEKAIGIQTRTHDVNIPSILSPDADPQFKSAGRFPLKWDVTKQLTGPLTSPVAGKMRPENLPFRVWATDILIEGVGWVEVSAQVRRPARWKAPGMVKKDQNHARIEKEEAREQRDRDLQAKYEKRSAIVEGGEDRWAVRSSDEFPELEGGSSDGDTVGDGEEYPEIEIFSPLGKFIGARRPMCGSVFAGPKPLTSRGQGGRTHAIRMRARPRQSMVSVKNQRKPAPKIR